MHEFIDQYGAYVYISVVIVALFCAGYFIKNDNNVAFSAIPILLWPIVLPIVIGAILIYLPMYIGHLLRGNR